MTHGTLLLGNTHLFWDLIWRKNVTFEIHSTCSCIGYWPMSNSRWSHPYNIMSRPPSYPSVWSTLSFLYLYWFNIMSLQEDLWWSGQGIELNGLNGWRRPLTKEAILVSVCALGEGDKRKATLETPRTTRKQLKSRTEWCSPGWRTVEEGHLTSLKGKVRWSFMVV